MWWFGRKKDKKIDGGVERKINRWKEREWGKSEDKNRECKEWDKESEKESRRGLEREK